MDKGLLPTPTAYPLTTPPPLSPLQGVGGGETRLESGTIYTRKKNMCGGVKFDQCLFSFCLYGTHLHFPFESLNILLIHIIGRKIIVYKINKWISTIVFLKQTIDLQLYATPTGFSFNIFLTKICMKYYKWDANRYIFLWTSLRPSL